MAASLETRVPFLDHELVEYAHIIRSEYKLAGYKQVLVDAANDVVARRILDRDKHGFSVPVSEWFRHDHEAIAGWPRTWSTRPRMLIPSRCSRPSRPIAEAKRTTE